MSQKANEIVTTETEPKVIAAQLTKQWRKAESAKVEIIRFGWMLSEVEKVVFARGRKLRDGSGVAGWLTEHCPEINYKTAMDYKAIYERVRTAIKIPDAVDMHDVLEETPGEDKKIEAYRQQIFDFVLDTPIRELKRPGRKSLDEGGTAPVPRKAPTMEERQEAAARDLMEICELMRRWTEGGQAELLVNDAVRLTAIDKCKAMLDVLKRR
ncbi:MAG: hypothetical protein ACOYOU_16365 [Kiritimatiellia bacterium]